MTAYYWVEGETSYTCFSVSILLAGEWAGKSDVGEMKPAVNKAQGITARLKASTCSLQRCW